MKPTSYGAPSAGVHGLQIEINRALYMNEATLAPHSGFGEMQQTVASAMADWKSSVDAELASLRAQEAALKQAGKKAELKAIAKRCSGPSTFVAAWGSEGAFALDARTQASLRTSMAAALS